MKLKIYEDVYKFTDRHTIDAILTAGKQYCRPSTGAAHSSDIYLNTLAWGSH